MPGIIAVLNAEIQKYQKLVTHLIASRDAILAAEGKSEAAPAGKKRGRPAKKAAAAPNGSGKKRGRPRKVAAAESKAE